MKLSDRERDAVAGFARYRPDLSPTQLRQWLIERYSPKYRIPSASSIAEVLEERGLVAPLGRPHPKNFSSRVAGVDRPNQVWCAGVDDVIVCADGARLRPYWIVDGYTGYVVRLDAVEADLKYFDFTFRGAFRAVGMPEEIRVRPVWPFASGEPAGLTDSSVWLMRAGIRIVRRPRASFVTVDHGITQAAGGAALARAFDQWRKQKNLEPGPASYVRSSRPIYKELLPTSDHFLGRDTRAGEGGKVELGGRTILLGRGVAYQYVMLEPIDDRRAEIRLGPIVLGVVEGKSFSPAPFVPVLEMPGWPTAVPREERSGSRRARSRAPRRRSSREP